MESVLAALRTEAERLGNSISNVWFGSILHRYAHHELIDPKGGEPR